MPPPLSVFFLSGYFDLYPIARVCQPVVRVSLCVSRSGTGGVGFGGCSDGFSDSGGGDVGGCAGGGGVGGGVSVGR